MMPLADERPRRPFPIVNVLMSGLLAPAKNGVAYFAHVGGFIFGFVVTRTLLDSGRLTRRERHGRWAEA